MVPFSKDSCLCRPPCTLPGSFGGGVGLMALFPAMHRVGLRAV